MVHETTIIDVSFYLTVLTTVVKGYGETPRYPFTRKINANHNAGKCLSLLAVSTLRVARWFSGSSRVEVTSNFIIEFQCNSFFHPPLPTLCQIELL